MKQRNAKLVILIPDKLEFRTQKGHNAQRKIFMYDSIPLTRTIQVGHIKENVIAFLRVT